MARPTKRTPEVETAILNALRVGNTRTDAALAAGVSRGAIAERNIPTTINVIPLRNITFAG